MTRRDKIVDGIQSALAFLIMAVLMIGGSIESVAVVIGAVACCIVLAGLMAVVEWIGDMDPKEEKRA